MLLNTLALNRKLKSRGYAVLALRERIIVGFILKHIKKYIDASHNQRNL